MILPVVYVEWIDSMGAGNWQSVDSAREDAAKDDMRCTSIGYLVADEDDYVLLAHSHRREPINGRDDIMAPLQIPRVAIKAMWRLTFD